MASQLRTILQLQVPVIVQIGRRGMSMDDVLALQPGAILELDKGAEDELTLLINNKRIGAGGAVKVGENFGLRINEIGSTRERIEALAGETDEAQESQESQEAQEAQKSEEQAEQPAQA